MTYGIGTRSYNRSTERRQMKREVEAATEKFERGEMARPEVLVLLCHCRSFRFSHTPEDHKKLLSDHDWRSWEERRNQRLFQERIY